MASVPKIYSDEFERDAVAMVAADSSQEKVYRDLVISKTALQTWVRNDQLRSHGPTPTTKQSQEVRAADARPCANLGFR